MNNGKRIVVVDDHSVVRELLRFRIHQIPDRSYQVVGESGTGAGAIAVCLEQRPDILMIDLLLPDMNGCDVTRRLLVQMPGLRVLFFSGSSRLPLVAEAARSGAVGYVSKLRSWQTLLDALNVVADGGRSFDPLLQRLVDEPLDKAGWQKLTTREQELVQLIAESHTTKEIAILLGISIKTADKHRTKMMGKLQLHDAAAVTRFAMQTGRIFMD